MPCHDWRTKEQIIHRENLENQNLLAPLEKEIFDLREELSKKDTILYAVLSALDECSSYQYSFNDRNTDLFALVMEIIDHNEIKHGVSIETIQNWWYEYKIKDQRRLEEVKRNALLKLTSEERMALGL
jgi:hypothetical protein